MRKQINKLDLKVLLITVSHWMWHSVSPFYCIHVANIDFNPFKPMGVSPAVHTPKLRTSIDQKFIIERYIFHLVCSLCVLSMVLGMSLLLMVVYEESFFGLQEHQLTLRQNSMLGVHCRTQEFLSFPPQLPRTVIADETLILCDTTGICLLADKPGQKLEPAIRIHTQT